MGLRVVESKHGGKARCGSKCDRTGEEYDKYRLKTEMH